MDNSLNLILLTKSGRCGTIFLQRLFDGHKSIIMLPSIITYYYTWNLFLKNNNHNLPNFLDALLLADSAKETYHAIDYDNYKAHLVNLLGEDLRQINRKNLLITMHIEFAKITNQSQTPKYIFLHEHNIVFLDQIITDFPHHKHVFMLREPKNSYASHLKTFQNGNRIRSIAFEKNAIQNEIEAFLFLSNYPEQIKFQKIEDLNANPQISLKILCDFLKIEFNPCLLNETILGKPSQENHSAFQNNQSSNNENRWHHFISSREAFLVDYLHRVLIKNHYDNDGQHSNKLKAYAYLFCPDPKSFFNYNITTKAKLEYFARFWFFKLRLKWLKLFKISDQIK